MTLPSPTCKDVYYILTDVNMLYIFVFIILHLQLRNFSFMSAFWFSINFHTVNITHCCVYLVFLFYNYCCFLPFLLFFPSLFSPFGSFVHCWFQFICFYFTTYNILLQIFTEFFMYKRKKENKITFAYRETGGLRQITVWYFCSVFFYFP